MATALTQVANQNLECPICLSFFKDPKILSCSHTFCKGCLDTLLDSHPDGQSLICPVCRGVTPVPKGDIGKLQTNIALRSLVADVETQGQLCANCDPEDKMQAVAFCTDCGEYLCESCRRFHSKWSKFSGHSVVSASDVLSGKIPLKRRHRCQNHPTEDEECFCFTCGIYVCFRCGVLDHTHQGHKIAEASVHETEQKKGIEKLTSKAVNKKDVADKFIASVKEQRNKVKIVQTKLNDGIDEAFEDSVKKLTERKELLKREVAQQTTEFETSLADLEKKTREEIGKVTAMCGLVENGLRVPLQKEALKAHTTLCRELEHILDKFEPNNKELKTAGEGCERLHFERSKELNTLELGRVVYRGETKWVPVADKKLPTPDSLGGMAASPDNKMSVGCYKGGILTYSADGHLQETVMEDVNVRRLQYFEDRRFVVRDTKNHVALYGPNGNDLNVVFNTSRNKPAIGGLTINKEGHIIISYVDSKKIQVFTPAGGEAVREITFHNFTPNQIFAMHSSQMIVAQVIDCKRVHVLDGTTGTSLHSITKEGLSAFPTVCKDDSVMIAWVTQDQDLVSIALYTPELEFKKTLINEFKIAKPGRGWYYLQQFNNGEIAFCTADRLYIFKEILA